VPRTFASLTNERHLNLISDRLCEVIASSKRFLSGRGLPRPHETRSVMIKIENLKSRREAACLLGVSVKTVYRFERAGRLKAIVLSPRCKRYSEADLLKLIQEASL